MSLIKYQDDQPTVKGNGRGPLHFARAHVDGMPFRGPAPMLKEEEYDNVTETVRDGFVYLFDLSDKDHHNKLQAIIDRSVNGWYTMHRMSEQFVPQPDGTLKVFVYCVWSEAHKEMNRHLAPMGVTLQGQSL